jgi:hypothetical protein
MATRTDPQKALLAAFDDYRASMADMLLGIRGTLQRGEYAAAASAMTEVSQVQARMSVDLRATLVRNGFIARGTDD